MSKRAYLAVALLVLPAPGFAQIVFDNNPPPVTPAGAKPTGTDVDKVECRTQDTLGSRLQAHKVCMTKQQWWQFEQDNKRKVEELQDLTPTRPSG